ncbi:hypothetical protein VP1G_09048 [Cytospora mali]|uniref:Uncharacterized protein n=1 Tax=Cytospora mali TaxID=578113 RepID=A0A194VDD7_CYTMA|nr:hypothetical protein VP1G_09048 [Valsa mali var. pyri (nom. inval.)]
MYAHYATAPAIPDGRPEYHMAQVRTFGMTDTRETFVEGAKAFRNARDLAKQHRDTFIQAANSRYNTRLASAQEDLVTSTERYFIPDDTDRQQIAYPCHLQEPDDQRDSSQEPQSSPVATEPPLSFTTRFISSPPSSSSMRTDVDRPTASSKRTRSSQSPPIISFVNPALRFGARSMQDLDLLRLNNIVAQKLASALGLGTGSFSTMDTESWSRLPRRTRTREKSSRAHSHKSIFSS